jgi:hypothetical protein
MCIREIERERENSQMFNVFLCVDGEKRKRKRDVKYPSTPTTSKIFLFTQTQTHTRELFGVDGNEKKVQAI